MNEQKKQNQVGQGKVNGADFKGELNKFESFLDEYMVKKAPFALPSNAKKFIAAASPYIAILAAILIIPAIFALLGISALFDRFSMMGSYYYGYGHGFRLGFGSIILVIIYAVVVVMELMAVPGLFKRTKSAWRLLFYASIIGLVGSVVSIHGIFSGVIGAIIGWYILFQMKDMYKN